MNIINIITLIILVCLFLFNLWQLLFLGKEKQEDNTGLVKWRLGLFILALSSLCFFIYFTSALNTIGAEQTLVFAETGETWVQKSNSYQEAFSYLPLVVAVYSCQWLMFFIQLIQGFNFFGRQRMQPVGRMKALR